MTTGTYLHNRTPNPNTAQKTPQERFMSEKPQIDHLCIFGSWAFVHIPAEEIKKLDNRARKCRFVGYLGGMKEWRFWDPSNNEFFESAHSRWTDEKGSSDLRIQESDKTGISSIDCLLNSKKFAGIDGGIKDLIEALLT